MTSVPLRGNPRGTSNGEREEGLLLLGRRNWMRKGRRAHFVISIILLSLAATWRMRKFHTWLPDGYSLIFRSYVFGHSGLDYGSATLRYAAKFDPFLSLDCAPMASTLAQFKERKGSNFTIW